MCGIAGIAIGNKGTIEQMIRCLVHRGPDGNAVWNNERAALGQARLAILDPRPEGNQPMWNDDHTIVITYNGELFNFRELRDEEKLNCRTNTDTEVILRLFEKYGMSFVDRLRGMFAFAIYETKTDTWHIARDSKGIKPLYIAYPDGRIAFASEMRSLMSAMPSKPALNMHSMSLYLRLQYVPGPQTMCEGIESLPPGTILTWQDGKEQRRTLIPIENASYSSRNDFMRKFPDVMDHVVKQHLVSDKPVGIFLSGGMDSSVVLHHMSNHAQKPIKTFTVRFDATEEEGAKRFNTDADLARLTARHYGTDHHEILLTAEWFRHLYKDTARSLDQPNADSVSVAQFLLSREAKKHVDVVLSGAGGDELFGGYPRYRIARILDALKMIPAPLRGLAGSITGNPSDVLQMQPGPALAERLLARPIKEGNEIAKGSWFNPTATTDLFYQRFAPLSNLDPVRAFMEFDRGLWLIDESLRLADATTMGSGLEARVPFVDERIIAASHATPANWHVGLKRTKTLLKDTYRGILPDHLYTLPKASFYPPLAKWLRRETAPLAEEMLEHARIKEFFDTDRVRVLFEEHKQHKKYNLHSLSSLIQLSNWFETVYDV
jgi:asparagine synthase (glutamine-hydrolysing)